MAFLDDIQGAVSRLTIGPMPAATGVNSALGTGGEDLGVGESNTPIRVDASIRENHSINGEVSEHPVESGADIVDHYSVKPRSISIEGTITNTPIETGFPGQTAVASVTAIANGDEDPVANAWSEIERYFEQAVVLKITTSLKNYDNMVLVSIGVNRSASTGNELRFSLSAREIRIVSTEEAAAIVIPVPVPKTTTGQEEKPRGKKNNKKTKPEEKKKTSFAVQGLQKIGFLS